MRSGLVEELPFPALAYRFTHELVRRALYDRLSVLRRAELHLRIAEALEAIDRPRSGRVLADLAHHFAAAAPIGGAAQAVEYNLLAARAASRPIPLSYDETAARPAAPPWKTGIGDEQRERAEILLRPRYGACHRVRQVARSTRCRSPSARRAAIATDEQGEGELLTASGDRI